MVYFDEYKYEKIDFEKVAFFFFSPDCIFVIDSLIAVNDSTTSVSMH